MMKGKIQSKHRKEYLAKRKQVVGVSLILIAITAILSIFSLSVNSFDVTFQESIQAIINRINGIEPQTYIEKMIDYVVIEVDMPRAIGAIAIGTTLAVTGSVMQSVTHNPLAEPYTIGISSAALFGVTVSIALGFSIIPGLEKDSATAANAFLFALLPAMVIVLITTFKRLTPNMMVLVGIGMMYVFSAFTTLIKFNTDEESLQEIYIWSLGTLSKLEWGDILPLVVIAIVMIIAFTILAKEINILTAGDNISQSLGVNPVRLRIVSFVLVSLGVAICVCYSGTIGFVGLVAPHITRLFTGNNNRLLIPLSAMAGTLLILIGDIIVRMLPGGLPAGVITALLGSPLFLYFLYKQRTTKNF